MKAVLLAAGVGKRLGLKGQQIPKCLLTFGGQTLLERHIHALQKFGARPIIIVVGYKKELVERELSAKFSSANFATATNGKSAANGAPAELPADAGIVFVENPVYHH